MVIFSLFSVLFDIVCYNQNRLKINITPYGEMLLLVTNLEGYIFEKYFTIEKLWDGLPVFRK